jgi:hypothetical protein
MKTVTLKHVTHKAPRRVIYFYDGLTVAEDGYVTLPADEIVHIRTVMGKGYRLTTDGTRINTYRELDEYIARS